MIPRTCQTQASNGSRLENHGVAFAAKVAYLIRPESYPERTAAVDVVQTHMSFVFLTDRHAYKLKKPVRYEFLDFSTLAARHADCREEMRLNRRLAGDVYLDLVALTQAAGGQLQLAGDGETVEWLVKMRRLPRKRMLDRAISAGRVSRDDVRQFMLVLADFYARAEPVAMSADEYRQRFERDIRANHRELSFPEYGIDGALNQSTASAQLALLEMAGELLARRADDGMIVEGHGDLRPEHVFLGPEPRFIDCLEFNRAWRLLDPVEEIAHLSLECEYAGAQWISDVALDIYCERTGDAPAAQLVRFYKSVRASLRAKLSVWHLRDHLEPAAREKWIGRARRYLELASRYASTP
ncbi:MAG: hypothetical protein OEP48_04090 [Betaproteobacteria bacterium]|nr:hypothetical protein [Betaproteobacteria bacterium]MDH3438106.1 hypothetical protein [Betaproteobacteria bacterium]